MDPVRARLAAALLVAGALPAAALAQRLPADSSNPPVVPGQVLSDAQPLPAEDRDSTGALVIHGSRVPAQRHHPSASMDQRNDPASVGQDVTRVMGGPPASAVKDVRSGPEDRPQRDPAR